MAESENNEVMEVNESDSNCGEPELSNKRSVLWNYFKFNPDKKNIGFCLHCKKDISYKGGSLTNLSKHLERKHIGLYAKYELECKSAIEKKKHLRQGKLTRYVTRQKKNINNKAIDALILNLIVKDLQPFSIVEDKGFIELMKALYPDYKMVTRKHLSKILLPKLYNETKAEIEDQILDSEYITITTDAWTSLANESYVAITAHYISKLWILESILLECPRVKESHTAEHLKEVLLKTINQWNIGSKIYAGVTDNAANVVKAIKLCGWAHLPCFAHTTNLIVQVCLSDATIRPLILKLKNIVEFFNRSVIGNEKLKSMQLQLNPASTPLKLKNDVPTRWNSTLDMVRRAVRIQEPIDATMGILHRPSTDLLESNEWNALKEFQIVLQPFEDVTIELSAEKNITISKIFIVIQGLKSSLNQIQLRLTNDIAKSLCNKFKTEVQNRFDKWSSSYTLGAATFLDPRFKQKGFFSESSLNIVKERILQDMKVLSVSTSTINNEEHAANPSSSTTPLTSIWHSFDEKVSKNAATPLSDSIIELRQYTEEKLISRCENPLDWWKNREKIYPRLQQLAKKHLCQLATSVPSERIFSKTGQIVSKRRSALKSTTVEKIIFLNANQ